MHSRVIAVTGVAGYWGRWLARRLVAAGHHVMGFDVHPPSPPIEGLEFLEVDLQNPLLPDVLISAGVEQILHLKFRWERQRSDAVFEHNVIGTTRLLEAANHARTAHVVLMGSTMAYGARPNNPSFISESASVRSGREAYLRHLYEIERVAKTMHENNSHSTITILRFAHIVGPTAPTFMNTLLKQEYAPTLLGFDPLVQFIHEEDVAAALEHAVVHLEQGPFRGAVNIAAQLPVPLARVLHIAGVKPVPLLHPLAYTVHRIPVIGDFALATQPIEWDYLRYPVVADTTVMSTRFGFTPTYDTETILTMIGRRWRVSVDGAELPAGASPTQEASNA